jgi:hypothetical protein
MMLIVVYDLHPGAWPRLLSHRGCRQVMWLMGTRSGLGLGDRHAAGTESSHRDADRSWPSKRLVLCSSTPEDLVEQRSGQGDPRLAQRATAAVVDSNFSSRRADPPRVCSHSSTPDGVVKSAIMDGSLCSLHRSR